MFEEWERHRLIPMTRKRRRSGKLSLGGMLFIMVLFHLSPFKDFKVNTDPRSGKLSGGQCEV